MAVNFPRSLARSMGLLPVAEMSFDLPEAVETSGTGSEFLTADLRTRPWQGEAAKVLAGPHRCAGPAAASWSRAAPGPGRAAILAGRGRAVAQAADDLDVAASLPRRRMRDLTTTAATAFPGNGQMRADLAMIAAPKKEVTRLRAERDILKKAAAFFAHEAT